MTRRFGIYFVIGVTALSGACSGLIDSTPNTGGGGNGGSVLPGSGGTPSMPGVCSEAASLAPARLWRLTDEQYVNVVAQVFGVRVPPEVTEPQTHPADFTNLSELRTAETRSVAAYETAARNAARAAVTVNLNVFLPCGTASPPDACVEQFIRNRIARAFGRPLGATEVSDLMGIYRLGLMDNVATGVRLIIEAALQAPSFLYRSELGSAPAAGGKVKLSAYEVATAVSFALVDSVPDDDLWRKATDNSLLNPAVLTAEIDRLLKLPAVQANLSQKAGFWLGVERLHSTEKDTAVFPEFTAAVKDDLYTSAQLFVQEVFTQGKITDLLTSRRMFLNTNLAKLYGVAGVTGSNFVGVDGPSERGAGILTQPAVLAAFSRPNRGDPVHRGLFIYNSLVCGSEIPPPPADALAKAAMFPKDSTERQLAGFRAADSVCGTCHHLFDPLGLSTEKYDPIGRYHESDAKGAIDSSATIKDLGADLDGPIAGLPDLVTRLKVGRRVADCAATNLAVFVLGRSVNGDNSCALQKVGDKFAASGAFTDYYRAMLTSPGFLTRDVGQ
ncbi:MAG TPA: DUF1592 domain-containing protein [Polyangia bacterium]|jgi:hypothetical protein|nr:DUF1592 domain-containing protein [Polyangia bacterium]